MSIAQLLTEVFLGISIGAYLTWLGDYSRTARWWENMLGRHQVIASGVVEVFLIAIFLYLVAPSWRPATDWLIVASSGGLGAMMVWRITIWRRMENAARILAAEAEAEQRHNTLPVPPDGPGQGLSWV